MQRQEETESLLSEKPIVEGEERCHIFYLRVNPGEGARREFNLGVQFINIKAPSQDVSVKSIPG